MPHIPKEATAPEVPDPELPKTPPRPNKEPLPQRKPAGATAWSLFPKVKMMTYEPDQDGITNALEAVE